MMTREEFKRRRMELRSAVRILDSGRLEMGRSAGADDMVFLRKPDGDLWYLVRARDLRMGHAIVAAVNFAMDLVDGSRREESGDRTTSNT